MDMICRRVMPMTFIITVSNLRLNRVAWMALAMTSVPHRMVRLAVIYTAMDMLRTKEATLASASRTRITATLGYSFAIMRVIYFSESGGTVTVARWVKGSASSAPGLKMVVKFISSDPQGISRRLAI